MIGRGYSPAATEETLAKLRSLNYLNDEAFALNWARSRAETGGYAPNRVEQELRSKGINRTLIREAIGEVFARTSELGAAKTLLNKKFKTKRLDDPKLLRRAVGFLQRRGFSGEVICDLLRQPLEDD